MGKAHHLADCRGYAYEHRIEAENKIGRRLLPTEKVHHKDGATANNSHDNLEVCKDNFDHLSKHRKATLGRRLPGEDNPSTSCLCGCGSTFLKYDKYNRPRKYLSGHNHTNPKGL